MGILTANCCNTDLLRAGIKFPVRAMIPRRTGRKIAVKADIIESMSYIQQLMEGVVKAIVH